MTDFDLKALKKADGAWKPKAANEDWGRLSAAYQDQSREQTTRFLEELGVGIPDNALPLEINLLRRIVDRLAVVYDQPASRWLVREDGKRYSETSGQHRLLEEVQKRSRYNLAWRLVDRLRSLHRQVVVRFYPSRTRAGVVLRTFEPFNVLREPSPDAPDEMDRDLCFALKLRSAEKPLWEVWKREGTDDEPRWRVMHIDDEGNLAEVQPFGPTGMMSPYERLPVQIVYDEYPGGLAWLPPRSSRVSWVTAINAQANDLWSLIVNQAHDETYVRTDRTSAVPDEHGHGIRHVLPKDAEVGSIQRNPKIDECREVLNEMVKLWVSSEDLPSEEFQRGRQVVTGAALRAQEAPLLARREAQVPLAEEDERDAWARLRAVHNVHAQEWGADELPGADLEVVVGDPNLPVDARELQEVVIKGVASGMLSKVMGVERIEGVSRAQAIRHLEQVAEDKERFGGDEASAEDLDEGGDAGRPGADPDPDEPNPDASMVQAARAALN